MSPRKQRLLVAGLLALCVAKLIWPRNPGGYYGSGWGEGMDLSTLAVLAGIWTCSVWLWQGDWNLEPIAKGGRKALKGIVWVGKFLFWVVGISLAIVSVFGAINGNERAGKMVGGTLGLLVVGLIASLFRTEKKYYFRVDLQSPIDGPGPLPAIQAFLKERKMESILIAEDQGQEAESIAPAAWRHLNQA